MKSFCELGPKLIRQSGCYLLTEVFCQDPLERYFSKQRHRGGGNDNPTVEQFRHNSAIMHHRQLIGCELKTMNVLPEQIDADAVNDYTQPLPKRYRKNNYILIIHM